MMTGSLTLEMKSRTTARAVEEPEEIEQLKEDIVKLKYIIVILLAFLALEFMIILWLL